MKFVHAADLHIDSPMRGLDRYEGAPAKSLRFATRRALENLVSFCIAEEASFLLLAGDIFDGSWKDYGTGLFFATQMTRLREANVPVVLVRGNHDAASSVVKALRLPENVRELSSKKPETVELSSIGVCIHGQSFAQRMTTEDLASRYPRFVPGALNIGLLHTSVDGREGHEPYAPTTVATMQAKGYDYWALGHVHAREVLSTQPWIVFPGNLQGRHARETGAKGATVVTTEDGRVTGATHRALDVARWEVVRIDAGQAADALDVVDLARRSLESIAEGLHDRVLAARVVVVGRTRANAGIRRDLDRFESELRAAATDVGGGRIWVEKAIVLTTSTHDAEAVSAEASAIGHLARRLAAIKENQGELTELAAIFSELEKRLPPELRESLPLGDPETVRALLSDVEQTLVPRLLEGAESQS